MAVIRLGIASKSSGLSNSDGYGGMIEPCVTWAGSSKCSACHAGVDRITLHQTSRNGQTVEDV